MDEPKVAEVIEEGVEVTKACTKLGKKGVIILALSGGTVVLVLGSYLLYKKFAAKKKVVEVVEETTENVETK